MDLQPEQRGPDAEQRGQWIDAHAAARGDVGATQRLLATHFDRLFRFCEAAAPGCAEDLAHDTLVACLEHQHRFRGEGSFVAYLLGVARNKVLMHWRTRARRGTPLDVEDVPLVALDPSPSSAFRRRSDEQRMLAALRTIPLGDQLILQMHYWDGLTGPALSEALGVPEGTVRSRLRRAKAKLASAMQPPGLPTPPQARSEAVPSLRGTT